MQEKINKHINDIKNIDITDVQYYTNFKNTYLSKNGLFWISRPTITPSYKFDKFIALSKSSLFWSRCLIVFFQNTF